MTASQNHSNHKYHHHRNQLALHVVLLLSVCTQRATAFGGLFGWPMSDNAIPSAQITQSSSILGLETIEGEGKLLATLHLQLEYISDSSVSELGWLVPLPSEPTRVNLGSALLFDSLQSQTKPSFSLTVLNASDTADQLPVNPLFSDLDKNISYCSPSMIEEHCSSVALGDNRGGNSLTDTQSNNGGQGTNNNNKEEEVEFRQQPPGTTAINVAGYLDYTVMDNANEVLYWLAFINYVEFRDEAGSEYNEAHWTSILEPYFENGGKIMAIQLANPANSTRATTQPIRIEYELPIVAATDQQKRNFGVVPTVHRFPYQLSAETAAKHATFDVYMLDDSTMNIEGNPDETESHRAVPVNYLDIEMDEAFVDWMGCHNNNNNIGDNNNNAETETETACLEESYEDLWFDITRTVHNQSMMTDYAGLLEDGYTSPRVPEGLTVILAASGNWLNFLTKLEDAGIPPIPLVLQIIDTYVPSPTFAIPANNKDDNDTEKSAWLLDACRQLDHLYTSRTATGVPTLQDCYQLYTPPSPGWSFNGLEAAAELDNRVFQPSRQAHTWMRDLHSLTRLYGRLDSAKAGRGDDPYVAMAVGKPDTYRNYAAVAAPVCQSGDPISWQLSIEDGVMDGPTRTFWQNGELTCPLWEPSLDGPILDDPASGQATTHSVALSVSAWGINALHGDIQVMRDPVTGAFDAKAIEDARRFGLAQLNKTLGLQAEAAALAKVEGNNGESANGDPNSLQESGAIFFMVLHYCGVLLASTLVLLLQ